MVSHKNQLIVHHKWTSRKGKGKEGKEGEEGGSSLEVGEVCRYILCLSQMPIVQELGCSFFAAIYRAECPGEPEGILKVSFVCAF